LEEHGRRLEADRGYAEEKKVTLPRELNSACRRNEGHPDYFCDDMDLTIDIITGRLRKRLKVLLDIYHADQRQGDDFASSNTTNTSAISRPQSAGTTTIRRSTRHHASYRRTKYEGFVGQGSSSKRATRTSLRKARGLRRLNRLRSTPAQTDEAQGKLSLALSRVTGACSLPLP
jgi:hypothetical protein